MSLEAANAFRDRLAADASLHKPFEDAYDRGFDALSELARGHGFDVSPDEAAELIAAVRSGGELTDYELELVAGGGDPAANIGGGRYGAASTNNSASTSASTSTSKPTPSKKHG